MNGQDFTFAGQPLTALPSGALWWGGRGVLTVSDLHLGKSERIARRTGAMLPPYETRDTLTRLETDIARTGAKTIICLGDSFDDLAAAESLGEEDQLTLARLQAGRRWIWIEGNHDPGPVEFGGTHLSALHEPPLTFRHIAEPAPQAEISGHYHPKVRMLARGRSITRPAFLFDAHRLIMPAYGTYTGGLYADHPALQALMGPGAKAILIGKAAHLIPLPRVA
ncbi:MAG: ligase-associated DNA damage response endonuclease PdeM [Pseudomonadota bacterium]